MAKAQKNRATFEEQLIRLEQIVDLLDRGETPIDEMMKLYEEGMQLLQSARNYLQTTEQKITVLQSNYAPPAARQSKTDGTSGGAESDADDQFLF